MAREREEPFDPLDYGNIARSVVSGLLRRSLRRLGELQPFSGAGIYSIYYTGPFAPYAPIAAPACETPVYVGKAVPPGSRKGRDELHPSSNRALHTRLGQHAGSIAAAQNLDVADFVCRFLVVQPVWIRLAEQVLLQRFRPVWNTVVDGFGNHAPGSGRGAMRRPRWDIVHPGRPWALNLEPQEEPDAILAEVEDHLRRYCSGG